MSVIAGWAWMHHRKIYMDKFNQAPPAWINQLLLHRRTALVKTAVRLGWPLPSVDLSDGAEKPKS
jgi:hypothetical protein